jgi:hypothetical protein
MLVLSFNRDALGETSNCASGFPAPFMQLPHWPKA